ncbi:hypothetical protein ACJ73_09113, partial [Blastomyces percursus]
MDFLSLSKTIREILENLETRSPILALWTQHHPPRKSNSANSWVSPCGLRTTPAMPKLLPLAASAEAK